MSISHMCSLSRISTYKSQAITLTALYRTHQQFSVKSFWSFPKTGVTKIKDDITISASWVRFRCHSKQSDLCGAREFSHAVTYPAGCWGSSLWARRLTTQRKGLSGLTVPHWETLSSQQGILFFLCQVGRVCVCVYVYVCIKNPGLISKHMSFPFYLLPSCMMGCVTN
jgi:hypothetical protein